MNARCFATTLGFVALIVVASGCTKNSDTTQQSAATTAPATTGQSPTPTPLPTVAVSFTDLNGVAGEDAIQDEAALGIIDSPTGAFRPNDPVKRREFVRWLVKANNLYFKDDPTKQIRLAKTGTATFSDLPAPDPDYPYIQGMANAGFIIGRTKVLFEPERFITREEMLGIKVPLDMGRGFVENMRGNLPEWADRNAVSDPYVSAVADDPSQSYPNITRIWGQVHRFFPQQRVTRSEAAVCLQRIGGAASSTMTAEDALGKAPPKL